MLSRMVAVGDDVALGSGLHMLPTVITAGSPGPILREITVWSRTTVMAARTTGSIDAPFAGRSGCTPTITVSPQEAARYAVAGVGVQPSFPRWRRRSSSGIRELLRSFDVSATESCTSPTRTASVACPGSTPEKVMMSAATIRVRMTVASLDDSRVGDPRTPRSCASCRAIRSDRERLPAGSRDRRGRGTDR